jgi:non-ribosomal peptide synthetase component F
LNRYLQVDETTRGALFASYAFDASIFEIFMTLLVGGTVCVLGDEERLDGFAAACSRMNVNFSLLTPTFLRTLLPADVPTLKKLCTGGEAIDEDLIKVWKNSLQLYNCYGPTETSIIATMYPYSEGEYNIRTIGRPTSGPAWIVRPDDHTQLVPLGVAGELVVGGSLARGYLNDSVKTNAAFVDSSGTTLSMTTSSRTGRIYKTGDLCQMSRTGEINYLGRIDTQVKVSASLSPIV